MWATIRLIRATLAFGLIALDYLLQLGLVRLFPRASWLARRWERLHARNARRLYRACVGLRGVYIKLGQVLSVMGTFLPAPYLRELEGLQDAVPARPWREVKRALVEAFGPDALARFRRFSETPVAAASLAQVHVAETPDGQRVAVKVLYPNVKTIIRVDLKVLGWGLWLYRKFVPIGQLDRILDQLRDMLARETDLSHEASCIARMAADFHDEPAVVFPPVRAELSTATILTMGFMDGVKVSDKEGLARLGLAPEAVAEVLVKAFYRAIFVHRFFHADPHPGNFLVQAAPTASGPSSGSAPGSSGGVTPRLVVLDLGSATPLMPHIADGATHALSGFLARDDARILEGLERIGFVAEDGDRGLLQATISRYFEKLLSLNLTDLSQVDFRTAERFIDPDLKFRELRALMRSIVYPEGWFELERTAVMLFALSAQLAPRLNTISLGLPWVMRFLASNPMPIVSRAPAPSAPGLLSEAALSASVPATPEQVPKGPTAALSPEPLAQLAPLGQAR